MVLVPLRWETDATPEMGDRPQAIINRQIVDQCDLVVGMFWTRLGTPTGAAESGTAEELDRAGRDGKPILLYFSRVPVNLEAVDLDEYRRLNEFKTRTYPKGVVERYDSMAQFRATLVRQLGTAVLKLIADDTSGAGRASPPGIRLNVAFAAGQPLRMLDGENPLTLHRIVCIDESDIPDYAQIDTKQSPPTGGIGTLRLVENPNRDYYRELVRYHTEKSSIAPVRLAVANDGDAAVRDIHMEIRARVTSGAVDVRMSEPTMPQRTTGTSLSSATWGLLGRPGGSGAELSIGQQDGDDWPMLLDLSVVQAGWSIATRETLLLQAATEASVEGTATVYSSAAPPFTVEVPLRLDVRVREITYLDLLDELEPAAAAELRR